MCTQKFLILLQFQNLKLMTMKFQILKRSSRTLKSQRQRPNQNRMPLPRQFHPLHPCHHRIAIAIAIAIIALSPSPLPQNIIISISTIISTIIHWPIPIPIQSLVHTLKYHQVRMQMPTCPHHRHPPTHRFYYGEQEQEQKQTSPCT